MRAERTAKTNLKDPDTDQQGDHRSYGDSLVDQVFLTTRAGENCSGGGVHEVAFQYRCQDRFGTS